MSSKTDLSMENIGLAAGHIWKFLENLEGAGTSVNRLSEEMDYPKKTVLAAIGWLAREEKLDIRTEKKKTLIYLA